MIPSISLIIDTSTENTLLVFFENSFESKNSHLLSRLLFKGDIPSSFNSSKFIFNEIEKALKNLSLNLKNLSYIAVGKGPGSYTGVRVGVTIAKTLCFSLQIPLISFCSLHAYVPEGAGKPFTAMIDAKSGGAYFQKAFISEEENIQWQNAPKTAALAEIFDDFENKNFLSDICTPNKKFLSSKVQALFPELQINWIEQLQNIHYLNKICFQKFQSKEYDPTCEILYR